MLRFLLRFLPVYFLSIFYYEYTCESPFSCAQKRSRLSLMRSARDSDTTREDTKPAQDQASLPASSDVTTTSAAHHQHAQKAAKPSVLDRYHSTEHSFPDYGTRKGARKMTNTRMKSLNQSCSAGFVNTLNRPTRGPKHPHPASSIHSISSTEGPPVKRQKTVNNTPSTSNYCNQIFAPVRDDDDVRSGSIPATDPNGSQATSLNNSQDLGLGEYRATERSLGGRKGCHRRSGKRASSVEEPQSQPPSKKFRYSQHVRVNDEESDELGFDESQDRLRANDTSSKSEATEPRSKFADGADLQFQRRFQTKKSSTKQTGKATKRTAEEISDDELASGIEQQGPASKIAKTSAAKSHAEPTSLSSTKTAKPAQGPNGSEEETDCLSVLSACCHPCYIYESNVQASSLKDDVAQGACVLRLLQETKDFRVFGEDGRRATEFNWMEFSVTTVTRIFHHKDSSTVHITRAADLSRNIGAGMMLKFSTPAQVARFIEIAIRGGLAPSKCYDKDIDVLEVTWRKIRKEVLEKIGMRKNGTQQTADVAATTDQPQPAEPNLAKQIIAELPEVSTAAPQKTSEDAEIITEPQHRTRQSDKSQTRRSRSSAPPVRWTEMNPNWADRWRIPLQFNRTTVDKEDIARLDEGECLNDNLISFGLNYYFEKYAQGQNIQERVHVHNSFFYEKLKSKGSKINYEGVKSWTAKANLLDKDYVVVPVNEHFHWWMAIICSPGKLDPDTMSAAKQDGSGEKDLEIQQGQDHSLADRVISDLNETKELSLTTKTEVVDLVDDDVTAREGAQHHGRSKKSRKPSGSGQRKLELGDPGIVTLDSLGTGHYQTGVQLKQYIAAEFKDKRGKEIDNVTSQMGAMKASNIPEQDNFCDCGVYLLGYFREFVKDPDVFIRSILQREEPRPQFDASELRNELRDIIFDLHRTFQTNHFEEKRKRRAAKTEKLARNGDSKPESRETSKTPVSRSPVGQASAIPSPKTTSPTTSPKSGASSSDNASSSSSKIPDSPLQPQKDNTYDDASPSPVALGTEVPKPTEARSTNNGSTSPTWQEVQKRSLPAANINGNGNVRSKSSAVRSLEEDRNEPEVLYSRTKSRRFPGASHSANPGPTASKPNGDDGPLQTPPILASTEHVSDEEVRFISRLPDSSSSPGSDKSDRARQTRQVESLSPGSATDRNTFMPRSKMPPSFLGDAKKGSRAAQNKRTLSSNVPEVMEAHLKRPSSASSTIDLTEDEAPETRKQNQKHAPTQNFMRH